MGDRDLRDKIDAILMAVDENGLTQGLGPASGERFCAEQIIKLVTDGEWGDDPTCVSYPLQKLVIGLNDWAGWPTNRARGLGLRRLLVAQIGTAGKQEFENQDFLLTICMLAVNQTVPDALISSSDHLARYDYKLFTTLLSCAKSCQEETAPDAARITLRRMVRILDQAMTRAGQARDKHAQQGLHHLQSCVQAACDALDAASCVPFPSRADTAASMRAVVRCVGHSVDTYRLKLEEPYRSSAPKEGAYHSYVAPLYVDPMLKFVEKVVWCLRGASGFAYLNGVTGGTRVQDESTDENGGHTNEVQA